MEGSSGYSSGPERGGRRRDKLAGYLKAANELRQSYTASYGLGSSGDSAADEDEGSIPGAFPDVSVVRNGEEEMLLFPSYARRHHVRKGPFYEKPGANEDIRDAQGSGNSEYWGKQWDKYEDDTAVVDVDIRGWVYSPHKGQMTRKNRLLVGIARHLSGVPAPSSSAVSSRASSPNRVKMEARSARKEEEMVEQEANSIERRGRGEADIAYRGGYSEAPSSGNDRSSLYGSPDNSRSASPVGGDPGGRSLPHPLTNTSLRDDMNIRSRSKQSSWSNPSDMSPEELSVANANLMLRLKPFLSTPLVQTPLTIFFYNDSSSKSRTVYTNEAGHFQLRQPLDFVPTDVRVLASDKLSATEEVRVTEPKGISMISDIDDTIKHSAIGSGAKEIFRNAFIRDPGDLTIDGVKEWYGQMSSMGIKLHYVSNAPWQLYPALMTFFAQAGLPSGSFHLKQYSGMLQGIFEPVAERKKGTLEKIMRDFPERRFLLAGDSGEADLELYTDILLANPGRILGVFIRDVTTTKSQGFFDSSIRPRGPSPKSTFRGRSGGGSPKIRPVKSAELEGPPPPLPPRTANISSEAPDDKHSGPQMGTLIDFDDGPDLNKSPHRATDSGLSSSNRKGSIDTPKSPPTLPSKPLALRSATSGQLPTTTSSSSNIPPGLKMTSITRRPAPPPPPRRRETSSTSSSADDFHNATAPADPSPLSQIQTSSSIPPAPDPGSAPGSRATSLERQSVRAAVKNKVASAYNALPSWYGTSNTSPPSSTKTTDPSTSSQPDPKDPTNKPSTTSNPRAPPPVPPRRNLNSYPAVAAQYASNHLPTGWSGSSTTTNTNSSSGNSYAERDGNSGAAGPSDDGPEGPLLSKKEELWVRRWARAKEIFDDKGVVLRSWRVGSDVAAEAVQLVERALKEEEKGDGGWKGRGR